MCIHASSESQLKQPWCERRCFYDGELVRRKRFRYFTVKQFENEGERESKMRNFENQKRINHKALLGTCNETHEFSSIIRKLQRETLELNRQEASPLSLSERCFSESTALFLIIRSQIIIFFTPVFISLSKQRGFPVSRRISSGRRMREHLAGIRYNFSNRFCRADLDFVLAAAGASLSTVAG